MAQGFPTMLEKLENAAPYNLFFNTLPDIEQTLRDPKSISFKDLLCPSLGPLKCSLQISFLVNIKWIMDQYESQNVGSKPLTLLYGLKFEEDEEFVKTVPNLTHHLVDLGKGCHHSKISIFVYEDNSLRIAVSTVNLYQIEWDCANQQIWLSPLCFPLPETAPDSEGDSPTLFKTSLLQYLQSYKLPILQSWIDQIRRTDFSPIKVFLVTSVPGERYPSRPGCHLHEVGKLLQLHYTLPDPSWPILIQTSSIGFYGTSPAEWLRSIFLRSVASHDRSKMVYISSAPLKLIYPTVKNVKEGLLGKKGAFVLHFGWQFKDKQDWLKSYLHQWKADGSGRSRLMPHSKMYCRISPCLEKLGWFLLTSANCSRGAWGGLYQNKEKAVIVRNHEAGVLFFPKFFDEEYFEIGKFPFMWDLPLTQYQTRDRPYRT